VIVKPSAIPAKLVLVSIVQGDHSFNSRITLPAEALERAAPADLMWSAPELVP